jgi:hypothetical protein
VFALGGVRPVAVPSSEVSTKRGVVSCLPIVREMIAPR